MDQLKVQPEDYGTSFVDSTFEVEGYQEAINSIRNDYPEETKTQEEKDLEAAFDQDSEENQDFDASAAFDVDSPVEGLPGLSEDIEGMEIDENIWTNPPQRELIFEAKQNPYTEREVKGFSLNANGGQIDTRERRLSNMIKNHNLDDTLAAFREINEDETLTEIFDTNGDGAFTYADMFDTHRWNGGKGITPEQDAEYTQRWLSAVEGKTFAARMSRLGQNFLGVMNKTEFMMDGRFSRLAPDETVSNWDNNAAAGFLEFGASTMNLPEAAMNFVTGGRLGTQEGKRVGDKFFGQMNENSMSYLMMTPAKRNWSDRLWHEVGYWGPEAILLAGTMGTSSMLTGSKQVMNLSKGKRLAMALNTITSQHVGVKTAVKTWTKKGIKTSFVNPTGPWKRLHQTYNLGTSLTKAGFIETSKGALTRDLNYAAMVGLYNENNFVKKLVDLHPDTWVFGSQAQMAIESTLGKRAAYYIDEASTDSAIGGAFLGVFKGAAKGFKWSAKSLKPFQTSIAKYDFSVSPFNQKSGLDFWNIRQQKGADLAQAGEVQKGKNLEADNPFNEGDTPIERHNTQGRYKNTDTNANPGEGIVPRRSDAGQILADANEIDGAAFTKRGSTDAILNPVDLAVAARHGVNGPVYQQLTKDFVEGSNFAQQLKSIDPGSRTVGDYGEGTLKRIQEIQGRDAASLDPKDYWGDNFTNQPIKAGSIEELDEIQKYMAEKLFVADSINSSLLSQLRDISAATGEMIGKQDIFTVDGPMKRVANNLSAGLSNVKQTRLRWSLLGERLKASNGKVNKGMIDEVEALVAARIDGLHDETIDGVRLMMDMLKKSDSPELVEGLLDVFKVSNRIHNWKDFDAWMRQKISGGEFNGKVKTGALIHELQGVMVNSILSGPKTPLRAILGTTTNAYLNALNEYAGAALRAPFTGDVIARRASFAKMKGMVEILPEAWQVFKENWNGKFEADFANIRTRYSEAPTRGDYNWHLFSEWTNRNGTAGDIAALNLTHAARTLNNNKLASWSPRALAATDDTFKWLLARARSKEIGMRQAMEVAGDEWQKFTPELMKQAEDIHYRSLLDAEGNLDLASDAYLNKQFKEITLTSELQGFSKKLDGLLNETPLLKPFYLFARTGINGLNLSFKNTPILGALHKESLDILKHTGEDFTPLFKYGIENADDLANARNLFAGRQAVGATVVTGIGMMYQAGQLTGNGPADRELKQSWMNAGWKPNHIYFGDVGFDYRSVEPFNVIFSSIADIGDNIELMGSEWAEKRLQAVAFVLGRGLTSKTYMSGLDQLMQVVQMKPGAWNKTAANVLNNSIPLAGLRNEFGKWINPHMKELNSDMFDSLRNRNQLTELATNKPISVKHDMLTGTPINNWNIIGRSFNAVSPVQLDIRRDTPGRRFLQESNYDLKTSVYSFGGYSLARSANVRSHFQKAIGSVPIEFRGRKFNNLEKALDYISTLPDVKNSMAQMKGNINNPSMWDMNPTDYPHNTIIDRIMNQARSKAWALINQPTHPGYEELQKVKAEKDGLNARTRDERQEILNLSGLNSINFEASPK